MGTWLVPREELTIDQLRAVEFDSREHRLVFGGPGSGKTIVVLHRAHYLMTELNIPPEKFRILVFTNVLKEYIRSGLELLRLPDECVTTFDNWCADFYRRNIGRWPWDDTSKRPDFAAIRRGVLEKVRAGSSHIYDFVLVDEGQDLSTDAFQILRTIARHITVFIDPKQRIFDGGANEDQILQALGLRRRNVALLSTHRCSPYVVALASNLISDEEERNAFIHQTAVVQTERQTPLVYFASSFEDERRRLVDILRSRQLVDERIAILLPQRRQVFGLARGLKEAGLEVEVPKTRSRRNSSPSLDFMSDLPKVMPYHSAKGLTFDSVLMPRLVMGSFRNVSPQCLERLIFVGISRAMKWVYLSAEDGRQLTVLDKLCEEARVHLTVQKNGTEGPHPEPEPDIEAIEVPTAPDSDDDWF